MNRKEFLQTLASSALFVSWYGSQMPLSARSLEQMAPDDLPEPLRGLILKNFPEGWEASLYAKGEHRWRSGDQLKWIGMPVGGLYAGQVHLGGDGRLWHWDVFNEHNTTYGKEYKKPADPYARRERWGLDHLKSVNQGFAVRWQSGSGRGSHYLDKRGFKDIKFLGEYPMGHVKYRDSRAPIAVDLKAFSPFIPLNVDDSAYPATVMEYRVKNTSTKDVEVELGGWLGNHSLIDTSAPEGIVRRENTVRSAKGLTTLLCKTEANVHDALNREDVVIDLFKGAKFKGWTVSGTAFGKGPMPKWKAQKNTYGELNCPYNNVVTSLQDKWHNVKDKKSGRLLSDPFKAQRDYIYFWIGGSDRSGKTCVNLLLDGKVQQTVIGRGDAAMRAAFFDLTSLTGQSVQVEIFTEPDGEAMPWIWVAGLMQTDVRAAHLETARDYGSMALSLVGDATAEPYAGLASESLTEAWKTGIGTTSSKETADIDDDLTGALTTRALLKPGESKTFIWIVGWHFKNQYEWGDNVGRHYATRYNDALAVNEDLAQQYPRLQRETKLWYDTWNDSSLPQWFLDRSFQNVCVLSSSTSRRYENGQFWAWEGVGCCAGTCTHVWQYAQAMARLFPSLERNLRERTDYGFGMLDDGGIRIRGNFGETAVDGQAGVILRTYREHQMSADNEFLKSLWPKVKKAMDYLMGYDWGEGLLQGAQHNTLDSDWYGKVSWLSSLYIAALRAAEEMAIELDDQAYADKCGKRWRKGSKNMVEQLYNGKYFINELDPKHLESINSGTGSMTDQVMGQGWAFQVGLGRILPEAETRSALKALFDYNFTTDVGPYREKYSDARDFAIAGDPGLIGCTFPDPNWQVKEAGGGGKDIFVGYFHECQSGYEYEAASHMIAEGLLTEGLTVMKAIDARYSPELRNPYNEIECGNYYARSMASYGCFLMACGFEYHGPKGYLAFNPKMNPEAFKSAFTSTEGWGSIEQTREAAAQQNTIQVKYGELSLQSLGLDVAEGQTVRGVTLQLGERKIPASFQQEGTHVEISLDKRITIQAGEAVSVEMKV